MTPLSRIRRVTSRPFLACLAVIGAAPSAHVEASSLVDTGTDLRLVPQRSPAVAPEPPVPPPFLDVSLGELYDLRAVGYHGPHPDGTAGLSAATTSCNLGEVDVPWEMPMAEDHPFIALQLYRLDPGGTLEMIGRSWLKHGFNALSQDRCTPCPTLSDGTYLAVGCSDTYSAFNNASTTYLGPREEVDPYRATWTACGSFFDGTPVDCVRDYTGETDLVAHRIEVFDGDLLVPGARYFYEGLYVVRGDDDISNNIGWQECVPTWQTGAWELSTLDGPDDANPRTPHYGSVIETWGDVRDTRLLPDDGLVTHAARVTDLGGGSWHYEYALFNRNSDRRIRSFSVPVGDAGLANIGFHDHDRDPGNDWTVRRSVGSVTWSTDDWKTDPGAPALVFGTMVNFRFDADSPPVEALATGGIFAPGIGTQVAFRTRSPAASAAPRSVRAPWIGSGEPNPFSGRTTLRWTTVRTGRVRVTIHDVAGRTVRVLVDGETPGGPGETAWDGRNGEGARVTSGTYFFRLEAPEGTRTARGTLLR